MVSEVGKFLLLAGLVLALLGAGLWLFPSTRLGRLPGDFSIQWKNGTFYFPLTTSILLSVVLTLVLWLVGVFRR